MRRISLVILALIMGLVFLSGPAPAENKASNPGASWKQQSQKPHPKKAKG